MALATRVVGLARSLRSADLEAEALQTIGQILIDRGEVAEGMGHLDEAMLFAVTSTAHRRPSSGLRS